MVIKQCVKNREFRVRAVLGIRVVGGVPGGAPVRCGQRPGGFGSQLLGGSIYRWGMRMLFLDTCAAAPLTERRAPAGGAAARAAAGEVRPGAVAPGLPVRSRPGRALL